MNPFDVASAPRAVPPKITQASFAHWFGPISEDYAAYRYKYVFKQQGDKTVSRRPLAVAADGYVSATVNWPAGTYDWTLYLERVSDGAMMAQATGTLVVIADALSSVESRPHAVIMVEKIRSLLEGRADSDIDEYTLPNGRHISRTPLKDLMVWYDYYKAEAASITAENDMEAGVISNRNRLRVRFV